MLKLRRILNHAAALRRALIPLAAAFLILGLGLLAVAGGSFAQSTAGVRMAGPVILGYVPGSSSPFLDITQPGMINLPDWVVNNPMRDDATSSHKIPAGAVDLSGLPSGGGQTGGLAAVASDSSLTGDGTHDDPLGVASPFTATDHTKLDGIEDRATRDQTPAEIVAGLSGLTGISRLPATAVRDLPSGGSGGLAAVTSDGTLTGNGTSGDPLGVAVAITQAQKTELAAFATVADAAASQGKYLAIDSSGNLVARTGTAAGSAVTIRETGTLSDLNAVSSPVAGELGVVYGDTPANNGVYFRTNTAWSRIADLMPATIPAGHLPVATSSSAGIIQASEYIKIANAIDAQDLHNTPHLTAAQLAEEDAILLDDASVSTGSELKEISISELDKRWKQTGDGGSIALSQLPDNTQIVSRAVVSGGNRPWPDDNIQIAGPIQQARYTSVPAGSVWAKAALRGPGGFLIQPANFLMRFAKTAYAVQPPIGDLPNLRIVTGQDPNDPLYLTPTLTGLPGDDTYWYANVAIVRLPADEPNVRLEISEPTELNLALTDGSVIPADLKFATGANVTGRAITISEGVFTSQIITDTRQVINGAITGFQARDNATSALSRSNLTERLNINSEPHGIVSGALTLTLTNKSNTNTHFHNDTDTITVSFTTTIEAIARSNAYNPPNNIGRILVVTDVVSGSTQLGAVVLRAAHDSSGDVGVDLRYESLPATTSAGTFSVGAHLEMVVLGSGAPRGLGTGSWFEYDAKPTDSETSAFADGDLILVKGADNQGAYLKSSTETHANASTNLGGKTFSLSANAISQRSGNNDLDYFARNARGSLPAGGTWTDAPSALAVMELGYNHFTLDDGFILIQYSADQSYNGQITITATVAGGNSSAISLRRVSGSQRDWRIDGLSANEVHNLRNGSWTFAEPDHQSYRITHQLTKVLAGAGNEYLLNYSGTTGVTANAFTTITSPNAAWTRALTADDDNRSLCVQLTLSSHSQTSRPTWSSPMCVNAGDWRRAAKTANNGAFAADGIYATGTAIDAYTTANAALSPLAVMIGKGTGTGEERLAVRLPAAATEIHRIKVWLD